MPYSLIPSKLFLAKLSKLDKSIIIEIEKKLENLKQTPVVSEHRMHHAQNYFRIYARNYRLIYKVEENKVILFDIIKRKEGYAQYVN